MYNSITCQNTHFVILPHCSWKVFWKCNLLSCLNHIEWHLFFPMNSWSSWYTFSSEALGFLTCLHWILFPNLYKSVFLAPPQQLLWTVFYTRYLQLTNLSPVSRAAWEKWLCQAAECSGSDLASAFPTECVVGTVGTLLLENPLGQNGLTHQGLLHEAAKVFGLRSRKLKLFLNETQTQGKRVWGHKVLRLYRIET